MTTPIYGHVCVDMRVSPFLLTHVTLSLLVHVLSVTSFGRDVASFNTNNDDDDYYSEGNSYDFVSRVYNRQLRPKEGGETDVVDIGMFVNSVRTISEIDMTVILDVFLQAEWSDHRLNWTWDKFYRDHIRHNMADRCMHEKCPLKEMTLGKDFASAIWRPDFYLPDAIHIIPADDYNDNVCVRLDPNYHLFYSNRLIITISCIMKLVYFPFDKHVCPICIGSYKYHDGLLSMRWSNNLSGMYQDQFTANFFMEGYQGADDYYNKTLPYLSDMFTEHCFNITIHRKYNIFLVTLYLPSVSLVGLSWVNFWIDHKAIPARASLSITAILAQITLIVGMASRFPSVSDLKMADLYLTVNFIYTFGTLVEFAIVSYNPEEKRARQQKANASRGLSGGNSSCTTVLTNNTTITATNNNNNNSSSSNTCTNNNNSRGGRPLLQQPDTPGRLLSNSPKSHHMGGVQSDGDSDDCILGAVPGTVPGVGVGAGIRGGECGGGNVLHNGNLLPPPCGSSVLPPSPHPPSPLPSAHVHTHHAHPKLSSATYSAENTTGVVMQDSCSAPNEYVRLRNNSSNSSRPPRSELREFFNFSPSSRPLPPPSRRCRKKVKVPQPRERVAAPSVAKVRNLDDVSKLVFPVSFLVWNLIFFSVNLFLAEKFCIFLKYFATDYCQRTCALC